MLGRMFMWVDMVEGLKAESFPGPTRRRLTVGNVQNATSGGLVNVNGGFGEAR
jgi:hypothetical protein